MCNIWIIGGTTEGRLLAEHCQKNRIPAFVSVASEYGGSLLENHEYVTVVEARLEEADMEEFICKHRIMSVYDASHPYASLVSENARMACEHRNIRYVRVTRLPASVEDTGSMTWVKDANEAAEYLNHREGSIFLSTGSKELAVYTSVVKNFKERLFVRVLPDPEVLLQCRASGLQMKQLIAMQGPFSREINREMFRHTGTRILVTKEAGKAGGYEEKIMAARDCKMEIVIIGRPDDVEGISLKQAKEMIGRIPAERETCFYLIGTGMGGRGQLTLEAVQAIQSCQAVLGAPRVLDSLGELTAGRLTAPLYLPEQVEHWLEEQGDVSCVALLYSGDTGFYSGCKKMIEGLTRHAHCRIKVIPGISSLSYFCAKLQMNWEDVAVVSLHGRDGDLEAKLSDWENVFVLLGGDGSVGCLCERLTRAGYGECIMHVGERLSYDDERITTGTVRELSGECFEPLCVALLERKGGKNG